LLKSAREQWDCYHLNIAETQSGNRPYVLNSWKKLMGDDKVFNIARHDLIPNRIALSVARCVDGADADRLLRVEE